MERQVDCGRDPNSTAAAEDPPPPRKGRNRAPPPAPGGAAAATTTQPRHANAAHIDAACEVTALTRANHLKREVAELQVKIEFQSLIIQHFLQRRGKSRSAAILPELGKARKNIPHFPDDNKLNQVRANLTTKAADFVHAIRQAEELEKKDQPGSSLAWYLKAQCEYPPSEFARQEMDRLSKHICRMPVHCLW